MYPTSYHRFEKLKQTFPTIASCIAITIFLLFGTALLQSALLYWVEFTSKANKCETSTSAWESYYKIELSHETETQFPDYKLYVAGELFTEKLYLNKNFSFDHEEFLDGVPILFIPGNCGFHEQGRTISSILTHMIESREYVGSVHFDYFTIDFNEESLAMSGHYLFRARVRLIIESFSIPFCYNCGHN